MEQLLLLILDTKKSIIGSLSMLVFSLMNFDHKKVLSVLEFAECTGYSPRYVREYLIPRGVIKGAFHFGDTGQWRIPVDLNKRLMGLIDEPVKIVLNNRIFQSPELLRKQIKRRARRLHNTDISTH